VATPAPSTALAALARKVAELAVLKGSFVLRSGQTSRFYLDKYRLATQPQVLKLLADNLCGLVPPAADVLAGPELGAVPLVAAMALQLNKPFVIVRKETKDYGTARRIEGIFKPGQKIVLVEDVLTTGGAVLSAAAACQKEGLTVLGIVGVLNRNKGVKENIAKAGFQFLGALFTEADLGMAEA
jgi:orotate phosphoribosyltransferase